MVLLRVSRPRHRRAHASHARPRRPDRRGAAPAGGVPRAGPRFPGQAGRRDHHRAQRRPGTDDEPQRRGPQARPWTRGAFSTRSARSTRPTALAAIEELDRVAAAGAAWLKLHPNTQEFDVADPAVAPVVRKAAECGLPVLFDAYSPWDANQPGKFVNLAMAVPESRLILAHAHGPGFPQLLIYDILARYPWWGRNVWIDISATGPMLAGSPFADQFAWVLRKIGVDRVIFGSDYPVDDPLTAAARGGGARLHRRGAGRHPARQRRRAARGQGVAGVSGRGPGSRSCGRPWSRRSSAPAGSRGTSPPAAPGC